MAAFLKEYFCGVPVLAGWVYAFCGSMSKNSGRLIFVAVFLGCTSTGRVGLCFLWFFVQELPKAQPAVVLVLKRLRRRATAKSLIRQTPEGWF